MKSQIIKHNKRYLKGTNFVRSIYSEKNIGILAIRILQREQPVQSELNKNYHSNIHNETINLKQLYHFWTDNIENDELELMCEGCVFSSHKQDALKIIGGLDIWNNNSETAKTIRQTASRCYGAHPSTNHNNERFVKVASRMASTGKQEKMANVYFIASNDYCLQNLQEEINNKSNQIDNIASNELSYDEKENDNIFKKKRIYLNKTEKLSSMIQITNSKLKDNDLANKYMINNHIDIEAERKNISNLFLSDTHSLKMKAVNKEVQAILESNDDTATYNNDDIDDLDFTVIPPLFNGFLQINKFCSAKNVISGIVKKEFSARELSSLFEENKRRCNTLKENLRQDEEKRFHTELDAEMEKLGLIIGGGNLIISAKLALLKSTLEEKGLMKNEHCSIFDIDRKKYFKIISNEIHLIDLVDQI